MQWRSADESFDEAVAAGREAVINAATTTAFSITGLSARETWTVRVMATLAGQPDGPSSVEASAAPLPTTAVVRQLDADGNAVDTTHLAYGVLHLGIDFPGVSDAGLAEIDAGDISVRNGAVRALRVAGSGLVLDIDVTADAANLQPSVTVVLPQDLAAAGSNRSETDWDVGYQLNATFQSAVNEPVTGSFEFSIDFFPHVAKGTPGTDPQERVFARDDIVVTNGGVTDLAHAPNPFFDRYTVTVEPDAAFEGMLTVRVPEGAVVALDEPRNYNAEASRSWRVDMPNADAALASLTVAEAADPASTLALAPVFDPEVPDYTARVVHRVDRVTVAAGVRDTGRATVAIVPADADPDTGATGAAFQAFAVSASRGRAS